MKKPSSRIREEIAKLQEQLKQAETRQAERIGRIALRAGIAEIEIEDADLLAAFEDLARGFREARHGRLERKGSADRGSSSGQAETVKTSAASGSIGGD
ncbi:TraC family protein (plasmid) [Agrobacterium tumefaciens]|nr:TraC family protein [Agrobacterium tumefaciens]